MIKKRSIYEVIILLLSLFSITTLTNSLWLNIPVNRILGLMITILILLVFFINIKKSELLTITIVIMLGIISCVITDNIIRNINDYSYWLITLLLLLLLSKKKIASKFYEALKINRNIVKMIVYINTFIIVLGFLIPSCYTVIWGESQYYTGFAYSAHSLCCGICINLALALSYFDDIKNIWIKFFILIPGTVAILESGARTYIFSVLIIWIIFYRLYIGQKYLKIMLVPIGIIGGIYLLMHTSFMDKMNFYSDFGMSNLEGWTRFTSGRLDFWLIDINAYRNSNIFYKLFGHGFNYPYVVNLKEYGMEIWAHNDFINISLSLGLIGLLIYLYVFVKSFISANKFIDRTNLFLLILYIFTALIFNGFYNYQHFVYSFAILYLVVIFNEKGRRV